MGEIQDGRKTVKYDGHKIEPSKVVARLTNMVAFPAHKEHIINWDPELPRGESD